MAFYITRKEPRTGKDMFYVGNNQWNRSDTHKMVFSDRTEAMRECNNVRGTLVEE